jgi:hypothetical protein
MGYFTTAYIVDAKDEGDSIALHLRAYQTHLGHGDKAYFTWGEGHRLEGLRHFADGTLLCDRDLELLPGYPRTEHVSPRHGDPSLFLFEQSFYPGALNEPVLFHILLPERFTPRANDEPFEQPVTPFVALRDGRLMVAYPTLGGGSIRMWLSRIRKGESLQDFDLTQILRRRETGQLKVAFEVNLGILKVKLG